MYLAKVHYKNKDAVKILTKVLKEIVEKEKRKENIYVCIGTTRVIFDGLGPIIGEMLKYSNPKLKVYGSLNDDINGENISEKIKKIKSIHRNANIIAIDACTSNTHSLGSILIKKAPVKPGAGVG